MCINRVQTFIYFQVFKAAKTYYSVIFIELNDSITTLANFFTMIEIIRDTSLLKIELKCSFIILTLST